MVCSSNGKDTALSRQRCEFDSRTDYKDRYNSRSKNTPYAIVRVKTDLFYWKVAEWLKAADCKSALFGVRGFESLPSNKMFRSSSGLGRCPFTAEITGSNPVRNTKMPVNGWKPGL